jgi:FkbM family methyltransferase
MSARPRSPRLAALKSRSPAWLRALVHLWRRFRRAIRTFRGRAAYCDFAGRLRLAIGEARDGSGRPVKVRALPWGIELWIRPGTSDTEVFCQVMGTLEYDLPLGPEPTIIDGGANIGLTTVFLALRHPGARIVAVEPVHSNYELLERNTRRLPNVRLVEAALWGSERELAVIDPGIGHYGYRVQPPTTSSGDIPAIAATPIAKTSAVTVGQIAAEEGWERIGLLKLDIEGAEIDVLGAAGPWIDRVDMLAVELHDRYTPGCTEAFLDATGGFDARSRRGELDIASRS